MSTTEKYVISGTITSLLSTGLNSLANNGLALSSAFDNTQGATGDGYVLCDLELVLAAIGSAYAANTGMSVWFIQSQDGTNYEDGDSSTTPGRLPDVVFPVRAVTGAQRIVRRAWVPWGLSKALLKNDATTQALASSGNTLKIRPVTFQGV